MAKTKPTPVAESTAMPNVGDPAPKFHLPDQQGKMHDLTDYRGRWVVLYFYPKDDTPGCTMEACQFRDQTSDLQSRGAVVLGVSPDDEASHKKFVAKFELHFPLLADVGAKLCQAYGVWQQKSMFGHKYMGVARTTYLIDPEGKIAHRFDKVKVTGHVKAVIKALDKLKAE